MGAHPLILTYLAQVRRFLEELCFRAICLSLKLNHIAITMLPFLVTKLKVADMVFHKVVATTGIVRGVVK